MRHLEDQDKGLQRSLSKTMTKFDELSGLFRQDHDSANIKLLSHAGLGPDGMPNAARELRCTQERGNGLASEIEHDMAELASFKNHLSRLKADIASETAHAARLEDFVRRIAEGPSASIRRGGGYCLDSTAKRTAMGLLKETQGVTREGLVAG